MQKLTAILDSLLQKAQRANQFSVPLTIHIIERPQFLPKMKSEKQKGGNAYANNF